MKAITYVTEKRIEQLKGKPLFERDDYENLAIEIWDNIFSSYQYYGATLKELESYLGHRLDAAREANVVCFSGIHGLEYRTNGNVRYLGTHDLSYVVIKNFNEYVKQLIK